MGADLSLPEGSIQIYNPIDCEVNDWQNTGACNNGLQNQIRQITTMPLFNGKECPILSQQINCSEDCVVSNWQNTEQCSACYMWYRNTKTNTNNNYTTIKWRNNMSIINTTNKLFWSTMYSRLCSK